MFKPVIKWSGSKRSQSAQIKAYLPDKFNRYYEPFVGGGSMLYAINPTDAACGDICAPLIDLWNEIKTIQLHYRKHTEFDGQDCKPKAIRHITKSEKI